MVLKLFDEYRILKCFLNGCKDTKIESSLEMGDKSLSFSWHPNNGVEIKNEYYVKTDTDEYVVKERTKRADGFYSIVARLNLEELEGNPIKKFTADKLSAQECGNAALQGTGWKCVSMITDKKRSFIMRNTDSYNIFKKMCEAYTCEVEWDTVQKVVRIKDRVGVYNGAYFMSGLNLRELEGGNDSYEFYTRIIPIGANGLTIASVNNGLEYLENKQYSPKTKTLIWEDTNYTNAQDLKEDAEYKLNELAWPRKSYSAKLADLARLKPGYSSLSYSIGDTVTLIDASTATRDKQRIVKMTVYPDDPLKNTCELANTKLSFDDMQRKLLAAAECIESVTNDKVLIGANVDEIDASQVRGLEIYTSEPITNSKIEDICK